ncbi:hypothetical protein NDU88_003094 [Pleurodeles waltl]|uniref:Uncharacterized protein n=1 Tax=Pleurodeles waltl TaxID=8319 RepID=A0AAV7L331_PLEWA|nr:hypothetical protein NDU88_003094 [Pleurodeles waltl]
MGSSRGECWGQNAEYPVGTRRSLRPLDTPVRIDVRPKDDGKEEVNTEVLAAEKGKREAESATEDYEKEFGEHTQLKFDGLKEQRRGCVTEKTMDPDYRDDETGRVREKEDELEGQPCSRRSVAFTGTAMCRQYINNINWEGGKKREWYTGKREW